MDSNLISLAHQVKAFAFDVDGVFTDGSLILLPDGSQVRTMNIKDGYAIKHLSGLNLPTTIISGGKSEAVRERLNKLDIWNVTLGSEDKVSDLEEFLLSFEIDWENCLYMGDDMPDLEVMKRCGIRCCPADACPEIKEIAHYISPFSGGKGCVRDVIEKVLKIQDKW